MTVAQVVPPGVGSRIFEKQSTCTPRQGGAAQWKPFCNKPPVKQQVYYEMSLSTCLLKAWALALARSRNSGGGGGLWGGGVVQGLHAISFTLCLKGADEFLKRALVLPSQVGRN